MCRGSLGPGVVPDIPVSRSLALLRDNLQECRDNTWQSGRPNDHPSPVPFARGENPIAGATRSIARGTFRGTRRRASR